MARAIFIGDTLNCDQIKIVIRDLIECKNAEVRIKLDSRFKSDLFTLKVLSLSFPYHERRLSDSWLVINTVYRYLHYFSLFSSSSFRSFSLRETFFSTIVSLTINLNAQMIVDCLWLSCLIRSNCLLTA